jgi:hypothetical protein
LRQAFNPTIDTTLEGWITRATAVLGGTIEPGDRDRMVTVFNDSRWQGNVVINSPINLGNHGSAVNGSTISNINLHDFDRRQRRRVSIQTAVDSTPVESKIADRQDQDSQVASLQSIRSSSFYLNASIIESESVEVEFKEGNNPAIETLNGFANSARVGIEHFLLLGISDAQVVTGVRLSVAERVRLQERVSGVMRAMEFPVDHWNLEFLSVLTRSSEAILDDRVVVRISVTPTGLRPTYFINNRAFVRAQATTNQLTMRQIEERALQFHNGQGEGVASRLGFCQIL